LYRAAGLFANIRREISPSYRLGNQLPGYVHPSVETDGNGGVEYPPKADQSSALGVPGRGLGGSEAAL